MQEVASIFETASDPRRSLTRATSGEEFEDQLDRVQATVASAFFLYNGIAGFIRDLGAHVPYLSGEQRHRLTRNQVEEMVDARVAEDMAAAAAATSASDALGDDNDDREESSNWLQKDVF